MQRSLSISSLILAIILLGTVQRASAAVTLISFEATYDRDNEEVKISWLTGAEPNTASYFIVRSADRSVLENAVAVDSLAMWPADTLPFIEDLEVDGVEMMQIPNRGTATTGAEYMAFDAGPADGFTENATYHYLLVERELSGRVVPLNNPTERVISIMIADMQSHKVYVPLVTK